ncbi:MAG: hypothetical protein JNL69_09380, partial [Bacteroidia bacterium]|nr:hypothetical protein [Bacteroidia bacterium]
MYYKGHNKRLNRIAKSIAINQRNDLSKRTVSDIEKEIREFDLLNTPEGKVPELSEKLSNLITGHVRTPYELNPEGVFRARKHSDGEVEFNLVSDISYPDWSKIPKEKHSRGRCHDLGENIFYCSTERDTAIIETWPKHNEIVTLIDFTVVNPPLKALIQPIGVKHLQQLDNGYKNIFNNYYLSNAGGSKNAAEQNQKIDDFLNDKFHEHIFKEEEWKYNTTIAITKLLMTGIFVGFLYPSISAKMKGANFVFKTDFADRNFRVFNGRMYKVTELTPEYIN